MSRVGRLVETVGEDLRRLGFQWALVGGFAVSVRAEPRFTRDIDLAVAVRDDGDAEGLVRALGARGYRVLALVEHEGAKRLATVRLLPPGEGEAGVVVDLLFASSSLEPEIVASAEALEVFPGVRVPVARVPHLISLKLLARDDDRRPQDRVDLRALLAVATSADIAEARTLLTLISERGFDRARDLAGDLDSLLGSQRS